MTQAILTKRLPATNTRGQRVKATAEAGSVTVHWCFSQGPEGNHLSAALALTAKFGLLGQGERLVGGALPGDAGRAFVIVEG